MPKETDTAGFFGHRWDRQKTGYQASVWRRGLRDEVLVSCRIVKLIVSRCTPRRTLTILARLFLGQSKYKVTFGISHDWNWGGKMPSMHPLVSSASQPVKVRGEVFSNENMRLLRSTKKRHSATSLQNVPERKTLHPVRALTRAPIHIITRGTATIFRLLWRLSSCTSLDS